jgi:hypothetical protein
LREFTLKCPQGARLSKVAEAFSKSGIPPLPLEWFDELLVRTLPDNVYLRSSSNRSDLSQTPMTQSIVDVIASIPSKKGSMGYTSRALGISIPELIAVVKGCSLFFYDPGMVFPCRYFEDLVVGYVSYETLVKRQERVELSSMSPFRHLVRIVAASLFYSPDKRIPSEHVLAWCHALDVKPRLLWQCLQDKVFWSNAHAELQVLRRNPSDSVNATTYGCDETALPRDLLDDIKDKVARLGNQSSIEKLSQALQWGKSSENRRKYGPLSAVLKKHPDIFYEPDFMFWKESLIKKVSFPETDIPSEAIIDKADTEFLQLSQISNMLVYYLTQEGYQAYPKDDILRILSSVGMDEEYLKRLSRVFVPGSNIYLRKLPCEVRFEAHSIEEFIFFALKASGRKAVEISKLFQKLAECESFDEAITSEARAEILSSCGNILDADQTPLSRICFYNPDVILLDCVATMNLQIPEQHYKNGEHVDFTSKQTQIE